MKFVDEYRDPVAAKRVLSHIVALADPGRHYKFMEVCGGHTHTIYRHGIEHVLPSNVELVHGPGCPVCVVPMGRIDDAIAVAETPNVIFTSFGDMMRVPGGNGSLLDAKARGADVRFVYSPLDALKLAVDNPDREVVFFAVGFETTAPSTAVTLVRARGTGATNVRVVCSRVAVVAPHTSVPRRPAPPLHGADSEVQPAGLVANPAQTGFAPAVGPFVGVVEGEGIPCVAVGRVVFPHSAPLPSGQIRSPMTPGGRLCQSPVFLSGRLGGAARGRIRRLHVGSLAWTPPVWQVIRREYQRLENPSCSTTCDP